MLSNHPTIGEHFPSGRVQGEMNMKANQERGPNRMWKGEDSNFTNACIKANVKPTHRQRMKWNQKRGSAWSNR